MVVRIGTLNTRGGDSKTNYITAKFKRHKLDILMVQETHCISEKNIKTIEKDTNSDVFVNRGTANGRGVTTIVRRSEHVKNPRMIERDNVGNLLILEVEIEDEKKEIVNIYAPNENAGRTTLFKQINNKIKSQHRVIGGDLNTYEHLALDSIGRNPNAQAWKNTADRDQLKILDNNHGYKDTFRTLYPTKIAFTYTSHTNYRARLDRIYVHHTQMIKVASANIHPASFSDHDLYLVELKTKTEMERIRWGMGLWKYNTTLLTDRNRREIIKNVWYDWRNQRHNYPNQQEWWDAGKAKLKSVLMEMGRSLKKTQNEEKNQLEQELNRIASSTSAQNAKIHNLKRQICEIEEREITGAIVRSKMQWLSQGETSSKFFFDLEKKNGKNRQITELKNEDNEIITSKEDILEYSRSHYQKLYSKVETSEPDTNILINSIQKRLTAEQKRSMESLFTIEDLESAHKTMKPGKSPGNDGLSAEFYKHSWEFIKDDLLDTLNEIVVSRKMPLSMTQGIITLIFKEKGERSKLKFWRPITLLNLDYKYLMRMIANKMGPFLGCLINLDQACAIKDRFMEDQLIQIQDIYDYIEQFGGKAMITGLDLEAAFDKIDHDYMIRILEKFNFGQIIIRTIGTIYKNMYSAITINGAKTSYFRLTRSIRQGDPASMALFVLAIEPLANLIRKDSRIPPVIIPNQKPKSVSQFADDTTILSTRITSYERVKIQTGIFERGAGAKLNTSKTEIVMFGRDWTEAERRSIPPENQKSDIKLLGVWFGPNAKSLNRDRILTKIDKVVEVWNEIPLSFQGKRLIINTKIISQMYHVIRITGMDDSLKREVQKRINKFFWHPKKMCPLPYTTLQNDIDHGGINLPNLDIINKAILVERIAKTTQGDKPWIGHFIYRLGFSLRSLDPSYYSLRYKHTFKKTSVTTVIANSFREIQNKVKNWSKETFTSLKNKLHVNNEYRKDPNRQYDGLWRKLYNSTSNRKERDLTYLIAHNALCTAELLNNRGINVVNECHLCGAPGEDLGHMFVNCRLIEEIKRTMERKIDPDHGRSLGEEEILFHEGRIKMKKKSFKIVTAYKHTIWITRGKKYYENITDEVQLKTILRLLFHDKIKT